MKTKTTSIRDFFKQFPNDDACLDHLMAVRYQNVPCPSCAKDTKYHRITGRQAYACQYCGHHVYPCVGTPFYKSRTSLQLWFYAMFMFCTTRNGVSAKELQRALGVTYKTAWRMGHEIRKYMAWVDGDGPLGGLVEVDKTYIGGHDFVGQDDKAIVLGMLERDGDVLTRSVPDRRNLTVVPHIVENVKPGSRIASDESKSFYGLDDEGYRHASVNHARKEYVRGDVHTNNIEAFWLWLKKGIGGTHVWVSKKHLQKYLCEFEYRYNMRDMPEVMFDLLLNAFSRPLRSKDV